MIGILTNQTNPGGYQFGRSRCTKLKVNVVLLVAVSMAGLSSAESTREEVSDLDDETVLNVSVYRAEFKTDAAVGFGGTLGATLIRLEDDLDVDDGDSIVRFHGRHRITPRQSIGFGYWSARRDGSRILDRTIEFDGTTYVVGGLVETSFKASWYRADWRYSLVQTEEAEVGFAAGISAYDFDVALDGAVTISGGVRARSEENILAPAPTLGVFMSYAISPRMIFHVNTDYMDLEVGSLEVKLRDFSFVFDWYFTRNVGFGVGVTSTDIDARGTGSSSYLIDYSQSGFFMEMSFAF